MTDLSYTAWDDNHYSWPPPDGWYQASDGKWWPEGYGPPTEEAVATTESGAVDSGIGATESAAVDAGAADVESETVDVESETVDAVSADVADSMVEDAAEPTTSSEAAGVSESWTNRSSASESEHAESDSTSTNSDSGYSSEYASGYRTDYNSDTVPDPEPVPASSEYSSDYASSAPSDYSSPAPSDHSSAASSDYSSPSSDYVSPAPTEYSSPSTSDHSTGGLAGWAQSGAAAATEVSESVHTEFEGVVSEHRADSDTAVDDAMTRLDDLQPAVDSQDLGLEAGVAGVAAAAGMAGMAEPDLVAPDLNVPDLNAPDVVASDLNAPDLDELGLDQAGLAESGLADSGLVDYAADAVADTASDAIGGMSDFADSASGAVSEAISVDEAVTDSVPQVVADSAGDMVDPTETLDIEPDELAIDANPYYGGPGTGYADQGGYESAVAGHDPSVGYPDIQGAQAEQHIGGVGDDYRPHAGEYGSEPLSPTTTPRPSDGNKRLLYVVLGLLALAAAGLAGYVLFQLQGDDGDSGAGAAEEAAAASGVVDDAIGSFVNPHQPDKGVRITVPVGESQQNDWMLEVRELATTSDLGDDNTELMITLRVRNDTPTDALSLDNLRFNLVTADGGDAIAQSDGCRSGGDLNRSAIIDPGKTEVGTVCWTVPSDRVSSALMAVESSTASGRVHVSVS